MSLSWKILTVFGIPVRLHWSMVLLPALTYNLMSTSGFMGMIAWVGLVVMLFGSVLLHELGHALTARRFGIQTRDIILTPLGGMARITSMPRNPRHEILISIAGPIVSLVLSGIAFLSIFPVVVIPILPDEILTGLGYLFQINLMLGLFNLVPALPMDGGRVLRGILALKMDHLSATKIAARVGRVLAVGGGIMGAFYLGSWTLVAISVFIYISAGSEIRMAQMLAYQEQMRKQGGPPPGFQRHPFGFGVSTPDSPSSQKNGWSSPPTNPDRDILVVTGGKAEVVSRSDPKDD
jgi:Zn-dependent protease